MHKEKVWILSNKNSRTLAHILVRIYFAHDLKEDIKIFDEIENMDDLMSFEFKADNQIIYYAFENINMCEFTKQKCKLNNIKYFDVYNVVYNFLGSIFSKISKGGNIKAILEKSLENNPIDFALSNDDGSNPQSIYESDIVIIGVSRTSKTPLSIYMSNLGYKVTNIPLIPEIDLPKQIFEIPSEKIIALVMDPDRLVELRKERIKSLGIPENSGYATRERVVQEIEYSHNVINKLNCKSIDVTQISIEETSERIKKYIESKEEF